MEMSTHSVLSALVLMILGTSSRPRIEPEITEEDTRMILWKFTSRRSDTIRPDWRYGQVKILADKPFRVSYEIII